MWQQTETTHFSHLGAFYCPDKYFLHRIHGYSLAEKCFTASVLVQKASLFHVSVFYFVDSGICSILKQEKSHMGCNRYSLLGNQSLICSHQSHMAEKNNFLSHYIEMIEESVWRQHLANWIQQLEGFCIWWPEGTWSENKTSRETCCWRQTIQ